MPAGQGACRTKRKTAPPNSGGAAGHVVSLTRAFRPGGGHAHWRFVIVRRSLQCSSCTSTSSTKIKMDTTRMVPISIIIMEFAPLSAQEKGAQAVCAEAVIWAADAKNVCMADSPFSQSHPCSSECRVILAPFLALCKSEARKRKKIGYAHKTNQHSREACCRF